MKKRCVLLDLDGTITDSSLGITRSAEYALNKFNIEVKDLTELNKFIGPPLRDSFQRFYGMTAEEAEKAVAYYREYYGEKGIYDNKLYDGIEELIIKLHSKGVVLAVATAKAEIYAKQILEDFNISQYFDFVCGSELDGTRGCKNEIIDCVLKNINKSDEVDSVIMVGDREHDVCGARDNGVECIGVLYGYGCEEELRNSKAKYIVSSVKELEKLFEDIC